MQYTYEEAVRELSDFLGKHVTADNHWKMQQVFITALKEKQDNSYEDGYAAGYEEGRGVGLCEMEDKLEESYEAGYQDGLTESSQSTDNAFQDGYSQGYETGVDAERDSWSCK